MIRSALLAVARRIESPRMGLTLGGNPWSGTLPWRQASSPVEGFLSSGQRRFCVGQTTSGTDNRNRGKALRGGKAGEGSGRGRKASGCRFRKGSD